MQFESYTHTHTHTEIIGQHAHTFFLSLSLFLRHTLFLSTEVVPLHMAQNPAWGFCTAKQN